MHLKLTRSQRDGGIISKAVLFCLDARVQFTPQEQANINRYKLGGQLIYNSEASQRRVNAAEAAMAEGTGTGGVKALAQFALARLHLNITVDSLQRGQHIECKSLEELLGAEDALMTACKNLKSYLETATTFDGREILIDFDGEEPVVKATAAPPSPMLAPPPLTAVLPPPSPTSSVENAAPTPDEGSLERPSREEQPRVHAEAPATQSVWGEIGTAYGLSAPSAAIVVHNWLSSIEFWLRTSSGREKWLVFGGAGAILFILYLIF